MFRSTTLRRFVTASSLTLAAGLVAACTGGAQIAPGDALAKIGVTALEVNDSPKELHIFGLDGKGAVTAEMLLTYGRVTIPDEGLDGDGRLLSVQVNGRHSEHRSLGSDPLTLPRLGDPMDAFLLDSTVTAALAKRGITFSASGPPTAAGGSGERPFSNNCTHSTTTACGATSCYEWSPWLHDYYSGCPGPVGCDPGDEPGESVCCMAQQQYVQRVCRSDCYSNCNGWSTACGQAGPSGCVPCWTSDISGSDSWCSAPYYCASSGFSCWYDGDCCSGSCYGADPVDGYQGWCN